MNRAGKRMIALAKSGLVRASPDMLGLFEYYLQPSRRDELGGGPFNGQSARQELFRQLVGLSVSGIVETGTFRGSTTQFMAECTAVPIRSVEYRRHYHAYARLRLRGYTQVQLSRDDSRSFLRELAHDGSFPKSRVLFYLDAHWYEDLPLLDELQLIASAWSNSLIMVDDFQVPHDSGYRFDDYGPRKRLCLDYLKPIENLGLQAFFPAVPSEQETGARRGCVVLGDQSVARALSTLSMLSPAS